MNAPIRYSHLILFAFLAAATMLGGTIVKDAQTRHQHKLEAIYDSYGRMGYDEGYTRGFKDGSGTSTPVIQGYGGGGSGGSWSGCIEVNPSTGETKPC